MRSDSFSESFPSLSVTSLQAEDSSTLRDLLSSDQADEDCLLSWVDPDTDLKQMKLEETSKLFKSSHSWLCDGMVLKLADPEAEDNTALFNVNNQNIKIPNILTNIFSADNLEAVPACDHLL